MPRLARRRPHRDVYSTLEATRVGVAASALGIARASFEAALEYSKQRVQKKPIIEFQGVSHKLAEMEASINAARLLTWHAAWLKDEGRDYAAAAATAKLRASDIANVCAREAVQIHGGYGYTEEFPVARYYRDAKVLEIGEGTSEILRLVLSRDLGLEPTT